MNISATAERICTKFTGKRHLDHRLDGFGCQGQRSGSPVTNFLHIESVMCSLQITSCSSRWDHCVAAGGDVSAQHGQGVIYMAARVRFVFGKTSLASSFVLYISFDWWMCAFVVLGLGTVPCRTSFHDAFRIPKNEIAIEFFPYQAKRLAEKNVSEMTHFVSSGT